MKISIEISVTRWLMVNFKEWSKTSREYLDKKLADYIVATCIPGKKNFYYVSTSLGTDNSGNILLCTLDVAHGEEFVDSVLEKKHEFVFTFDLIEDSFLTCLDKIIGDGNNPYDRWPEFCKKYLYYRYE